MTLETGSTMNDRNGRKRLPVILLRRLLALAIGGVFFFSAIVQAAAQTSFTPSQLSHWGKSVKSSETKVYLMRGLFGVFSLGMDDLAGKLKAHGFTANVYPWDDWETIVNQIAVGHQQGQPTPVAIIGHSLGANSTFQVADSLNSQNIPVILAVTFDSTEPGKVPPNVVRFINFFALDGFGHKVEAGPGFTGELTNIDLTTAGNITHTNIDALDRFHQMIITTLLEMTSR
jgi:hypothetical protein